MLSADTHKKEQGAAISTHQQDPEKVRSHIGIKWHLSTEGTIGNYKNCENRRKEKLQLTNEYCAIDAIAIYCFSLSYMLRSVNLM